MPEITGPLQWAMFQEQQRSQKVAKENEDLLGLLSGLSKWKTEQDRWKTEQEFGRQKWADEAAQRAADVQQKQALSKYYGNYGDYLGQKEPTETDYSRKYQLGLQLYGGDQQRAYEFATMGETRAAREGRERDRFKWEKVTEAGIKTPAKQDEEAKAAKTTRMKQQEASIDDALKPLEAREKEVDAYLQQVDSKKVTIDPAMKDNYVWRLRNVRMAIEKLRYSKLWMTNTNSPLADTEFQKIVRIGTGGYKHSEEKSEFWTRPETQQQAPQGPDWASMPDGTIRKDETTGKREKKVAGKWMPIR